MTHVRRTILSAALVAAALVVPAAAPAHTSTWQATALVNCALPPGAPAPPAHSADDVVCSEQQRYVLRLDGVTLVVSETNGRLRDGTLDYQRLPTLIRRSQGFDLFNHLNPHVYPLAGSPFEDAITGAQPHATCKHPSLDNAAAIRAWQPNHGSGQDPLFAYVPFQAGTAGLNWNADEREPQKWIDVVKQHTGVDLAAGADTEVNRRNKCETVIGGTYYPADTVSISIAAMSSVTVAQAVAPLQSRIAALESDLAARDATIATLTSSVSGSAASPATAALQAEIASLKLALEPLEVVLPPSTPSASSLAGSGITVAVSGPAQRTFRARLRLSAADARRLGTRQILATESVTLDAGGTARVTLEPSAAAAARLRRTTRNLLIAVEATGGDRIDVATATARR